MLFNLDDELDAEARHTDRYLETPSGPDALQKRLLRLAKDAKTAEEEQGINVLYLALGFLTWFETPSSSVQREAPLILLPVELIRDDRRSTYDIVCRSDDITTNLPLQERLKQDFGVALPTSTPMTRTVLRRRATSRGCATRSPAGSAGGSSRTPCSLASFPSPSC